MNNIFSVDSEIVVITGVSGQLGSAYAKYFLDNGSEVVGLDLNLNKQIESLRKDFPKKLLLIEADVTNKKSLSDALKLTIKKFGHPTVLLNNAAIDSPPSSCSMDNGYFEEYPEDSWDRVVDVNLKGVFLTCQVFGGDMAKQAGGSIINISSIYGVVSPDQSIYEYRRRRGEVFFKPVAYAVTKSGLINMTRYLSVYWAKNNVRVNTLTIAGVFNNQEKDFLDAYCKRIPIGRMAYADDYLGPVGFLASKASLYMTGSNLIIDGGWTAI
jgi:NAD(P)-dependent dehydrogenase (short-subunit alcohol dehydrogenase family)